MNKILASFIFACSVPFGFLLKILNRNRYKITIDKNMGSYRCKPDNIEIASQKNKSRDQKSDDDADCPDTLYPMW